ncbi:MAG: 3-dehydroquinate synthase [Methylocystaceae bacterium]
MEQLTVNLGERSYPIYLGNQILSSLPEIIKAALPGLSRLAVITDQTVDSCYGKIVTDQLLDAGFLADKVVIAGGEDHKNLTTVECVSQRLVELGLDRDSAVVALGGGIVGDIAGFVAAAFMRGIRYIQVPSTLLAQVDSSVGGKTGVNLPGGKNLVGAFCQPQLVLTDVSLLNTLNEREFRTGLAEIIKYGIIRDAALFNYIEQNQTAILARNPQCLLEIISRCCAIKADIVARDEKEKGERALLNLGHTFGHAFETLSNYTYNHGEAVAAGLVYASQMASNLGWLKPADVQRITKLIAGFGLPIQADGRMDVSSVIEAMYHDKKGRQGQLNLVLPTSIGSAVLTNRVTDNDIAQVLA